MSHVYVDSNATGGGTGADWANAFTTLAAAFTAKAAGDQFWVSHLHAETQNTAMTITGKGTAAAPCTIACVNSAGSVPPVSADLLTSATITTTGNSTLTLSGGHDYYYGITLSAGSGAVAVAMEFTGSANHYFKKCSLKKLGTTASATAFSIGATAVSGMSKIVFDETPCTFGSTGDSISPRNVKFLWKNTSNAILGSVPTNLLVPQGGGTTVLDGVDLSAMVATKNIVGTNSSGTVDIIVKNCKLAATLGAVAVAPASIGSAETYLVASDSGAKAYRQEKHNYFGSQTTEETIVRTGGASNGTNAFAAKIVTNANAKWITPFESIPMPIWNDVTAANVTVTVYGVWTGGALPKNDDVWLEVGYVGNASTPLQIFDVSTTKANFIAANADQPTDASTWGGGTTKFKLTATLASPQAGIKGPMYAVVKVGVASATVYIDPKVVLS